jgi:hypothetical protein
MSFLGPNHFLSFSLFLALEKLFSNALQEQMAPAKVKSRSELLHSDTPSQSRLQNKSEPSVCLRNLCTN